MSKKAVFFDIDGTLWDSAHVVPDDTARAIRQLRANGHYAFINTGRSQGHIITPNLLEVGWDGFVSGCGTYVQVGQRVVKDLLIDPAELERVVLLAREHGVRIILEGRFCLYFDDNEYADDPYGSMLIRELGEKRRTIAGEWGKWRAGKFSVDLNEETGSPQWLEEMNKDYYCLRHGGVIVELVPYGCSKASGMEVACRYLGVDMKDSIAFGDSTNDLDMIQAAGTGVAMGGATEAAKSAADIVTSDAMEGGISRGLRELGLI